MRVSVISDNGDMFVHKAGCADVARHAKRLRNGDSPWPIFEAESKLAVLCEIWDCIWQEYAEGDEKDPQVQAAAIRESMSDAATKFLPCCNGLSNEEGF